MALQIHEYRGALAQLFLFLHMSKGTGMFQCIRHGMKLSVALLPDGRLSTLFFRPSLTVRVQLMNRRAG